mgnify:CR=1 FL=1
METQTLEGVATETENAPEMVKVLVEKRDGRVVDFDPINIISAVKSAFADLDKKIGPQEERLIRDIANQVEAEIKDRYNGPAKIEDIQNLVEHGLIEDHLYDVARTYTNYRLNKDIERAKATDINEAVRRLVDRDEALVRENANKDSNVYSTQRDLLAGAVSKASAFSMLPDAVSNAHMKGDIHFHDADYSPFTAQSNCSLPNYWDMLANGFTLGNAPMGSPNSISIAATQITQIMKDVASSQYGGQTANRADEHFAEYAKKDYDKFLEQAHEIMPDDLPIEIAERQVRMAKAVEPKRLHFEKDRPALPMDEPFDKTSDRLQQLREIWAKIQTRKAIYDAMQTMEYQINSNRVSNGQTPFVTVGFGLGTDWFAREIQRAIFLNRIRGLGSEHHTAIFPKLVFTIKHGVNADPGDPNYDLKQLALECATKRMYPDVIFYENIVKITGSFKAPMGCRSFLSPWKDENGEYKWEGRFNQGVVSINLPQIGILAKGNEEKFWKLLDERLELCYEALMCRHKALEGVVSDVSPIHWQYGAIARLKKGETIDKYLHNGYSTMSLGYIGLYEMTYLMKGCSQTVEPGKEFALRVMDYMKERCAKWKEETGIAFSLYGTPAETLCYRFARIDREKYGDISNVTDKGYYTNSYHVDVREKIDAFTKFKIESEFQNKSLGGAISYVEVPNLTNNVEAIEEVIRFIYDNIQYGEFNTKSDYCQVCGYDGEIMINDNMEWECPQCHNKDHAKMNVTRRTCGYLGENFWNAGKTKEIKARVLHL